MRPLISYAGGKFLAVKTLREYIPRGLDSICCPFLGGGSFEISLALDNITVFASDIDKGLCEMWQEVLKDPEQFADDVLEYYPMNKDRFHQMRLEWPPRDKHKRAIQYYVLCRCAFNGLTHIGGYRNNPIRFKPEVINHARKFNLPYLNVSCLHWRDALEYHRNRFLYLDPPYPLHTQIYSHDDTNGFNHVELAEVLLKRQDWVLSYNDVPVIRELYKGCDINPVQWRYTMGIGTESHKHKVPNELIIRPRGQRGAEGDTVYT